MRKRYVEGAKDLINAHPDLIINIDKIEMINFRSKFNNDLPIHVEIGMGKGIFIHTLAKNNPNINYIGIERFDSIIVKALDKVIENPLKNLILLRTDAVDLNHLIEKGSINRIYLNFSDPWPKARHEKRRLTSHKFLDRYKRLLLPNSELHFKTDNLGLFDFSVEELTNYPMDIIYITRDLHNSDFVGNIMTEFESKFAKRGNLIYKLTAKFKENENG